MSALSTCTISLVGTQPGQTHGALEKRIKSLGGKFAKNLTQDTTHLVSLSASSHASAKAQQAHRSGVKVVTLAWLDKCVEDGRLVGEDDYLVRESDGSQDVAEDAAAPAPALRRSGRAAAATGKADAEPPAALKRTQSKVDGAAETQKAAPPVKKVRGGAKGAVKEEEEGEDEEMKDAEKEEEEEKPKRAARGRKAASASQDDAKDAPVGTAGRAKRGAAGKKKDQDGDVQMKDAEEDGEPEEKEEKPKRGRAKKVDVVVDSTADAEPEKKVAKGKGKGKKAKKDEDEEEEEKKPVPNIKVLTKQKGQAPVDEFVPNRDSYKVYCDGQGVFWDGALNQTNIGANANKFYYVQLLETANKQYAVWTRWGRVGESGQKKMVQGPTTLGSAQSVFDRKFRDKSGLPWASRFDPPKYGKYTFIEKNYEDDDEDEEGGSGSGENGEKGDGEQEEEDEKAVIPEPTIHPALQKLMELIFNVGFFTATMESMQYDANKLPLGKLSKSTIKRGYEILKQLGEVIANPGAAQSIVGLSAVQACQQLSNQYYSVIPHAFGRNVPTVIRTAEQVKKEADLIDSLGDMKIASEIMKLTSAKSKARLAEHPLDTQFKSLSLNTAEPIDRSSREFAVLSDYMKKTHGGTHDFSLEIEEIFRIHRQEEEDRWREKGWDDHPIGHRALLWHGSRATNFGGILSQGLRIAPPEAPVNGYMFGKGIYLADMASKSAGYCCSGDSNNTGLLLLCEAQIGNPQYELSHSSYDAGKECRDAGRLATKGIGRNAPKKWVDAGEAGLGEWAKGAYMPDCSGTREETVGEQETDGYLYYNEFIVYDVSQVKIRYLFRVKFD